MGERRQWVVRLPDTPEYNGGMPRLLHPRYTSSPEKALGWTLRSNGCGYLYSRFADAYHHGRDVHVVPAGTWLAAQGHPIDPDVPWQDAWRVLCRTVAAVNAGQRLDRFPYHQQTTPRTTPEPHAPERPTVLPQDVPEQLSLFPRSSAVTLGR